MKLRIDESLCTGHGRCWTLAPNVYQSDDDGYNAARGQVIDVQPGHEDQARLGMRACPEVAITLAEEDG